MYRSRGQSQKDWRKIEIRLPQDVKSLLEQVAEAELHSQNTIVLLALKKYIASKKRLLNKKE